jgi:hypothetical protein
MQQTGNRFGGTGQKNRIADLRASVRSAAADPAKPPKPRKEVKRESDEERALKAERQAMAQHKTSLLAGGNSKKPYKRPGEREERKSGGLIFQLVLVMVLAGGVAVALDPSIIPPEWIETGRSFIGQYVKI